MKPYRSGRWVVGNRFLIDRSTGQVSFHCRSSMQILASSLPPDATGQEAAAPANHRSFTDADRLAAFLPAIHAAMSTPASTEGCQQAQDDPFWGVIGPLIRSDKQVRELTPDDREPAYYNRELPPPPNKPKRPWTDSDEQFYRDSVTNEGYAR